MIRVSLLGRPSIRCGDATVASLDTRKVQELFWYLLLYRTLAHPRDALADLLWEESLTARRYLRKALWHLQSTLNTLAPSVEPNDDSRATSQHDSILLVEQDWIQINPHASLWLDIAVFEEVFGRVEGIAGHTLDAPTAAELERATALYHGDLLAGWYADWCLFERERFRQMYLAMLDKLMAYYGAHQEYERSIICGLRVLQHDPAREHTHRRLMRLYDDAGDRTAALHQYELCVVALAEKLDVQPSARTTALYAQIRTGSEQSAQAAQDRLPTPSSEPRAVSAANGALAPPSSPLKLPNPQPQPADAVAHLEQVRILLVDFQQQVQQQIQSVDLSLQNLTRTDAKSPKVKRR